MRVSVDIDLNAIDTFDLLDVLVSRNLSEQQLNDLFRDMKSGGIRSLLKRMGVPSDLIDPLEAWFRQPITDRSALLTWNRSIC